MMELWHTYIYLAIGEMEDSRVGSDRDDSHENVGVGPLATRISSLLPIVGTLVLVSAYCVLCIAIFLVLRSRLQLAYVPRTQPALVPLGYVTPSPSS
jgi:hypothetical protein